METFLIRAHIRLPERERRKAGANPGHVRLTIVLCDARTARQNPGAALTQVEAL